MEINLHNYEAFFLDYKEGNLSPVQEKELFLFLEKHPHLYEELDAFENIVLENIHTDGSSVNKSVLKKTEHTNEDLIAYTEGLLSEQNEKEIDVLAAQNSALKKELAFYEKTKVQADLSEKFKNKSKLKRGGLIISLQNNYTFLRVAAAILLLIGFFFLMSKINTREETGKDGYEIANFNKNGSYNKETPVRKEAKPEQRNQETEGSLQYATNNEQKTEQSASVRKQLAVNSGKRDIRKNKEQKTISTIQTNSVVTNNSVKDVPKDTVPETTILVQNTSQKEDQKVNRSYYNYRADKEDDETPVVASTTTGKKSFFQKLVKVAKKVNDLGVKNVDATEESDSNSLSIGSLVVEETIATRPVNKN